MPNSLPPSSPPPSPPPTTLPWYAQWWVPGVLVSACVVYLSVLAGGYVTASAEPYLPAAPAARPAAAPVVQLPEEPSARVVAAAAPLEKRPEPEPKPQPKPQPPVAVAPVLVSAPVALPESRAMARAIARSATLLQRTSAVSGLSPFASAAPAGTASAVWVAPVASYRLTARFGDHGRHWASTHTGLDFAAPTGTPVVAVDAGVVTTAGWDGPYGQQVVVRHADGTLTSYAHLSSLGVARGATVAQGQLVGRVGATGNVTGPHLHLEVRPYGGAAVDPGEALRQHGVPIP